jgi:lysophospholipase L1-like esterase
MTGEISAAAAAFVFFAGMPFCHSAEARIKVALAGDSTVASYKEKDIAGWGQFIGLRFTDGVSVENFAVCGRSTKTFLEKGDWGKLIASKPDYIIVQFGHNDSHGKGKPESTDAATDYRDNLRKFADDAKASGARLIFVTPVRRRTFNKDGSLSDNLQPYADAMKAVAAEKGVPYVDLHSSSGELLLELGDEKSAFMSCKPEDRTHFSPAGAEKIAGLAADGIKNSGSDLKKYVK